MDRLSIVSIDALAKLIDSLTTKSTYQILVSVDMEGSYKDPDKRYFTVEIAHPRWDDVVFKKVSLETGEIID